MTSDQGTDPRVVDNHAYTALAPTVDELRQLVADICTQGGHPDLAREINVVNAGSVRRPGRALTITEALTMAQVWHRCYAAIGVPVCPHDDGVHRRRPDGCECPQYGTVPDYLSERVLANVMARLMKPTWQDYLESVVEP